ncbi:unnamed protein product [Amoebophrya sp. A120]|nr:unnamed protein product [Amoebophrya sp. A120]|eukprot:GSA120T00013391001.1
MQDPAAQHPQQQSTSTSLKELCRDFFVEELLRKTISLSGGGDGRSQQGNSPQGREQFEGGVDSPQSPTVDVAKNLNAADTQNKFLVICDQCGLRVLNSICRLSDLYETGVTAVEALESKDRQPIPSLDGVYFIDPEDADSVGILLKQDFPIPTAAAPDPVANLAGNTNPMSLSAATAALKSKLPKTSSQQKEQIQHDNVHLFFTRKCPDEVLRELSRHPLLAPRIRNVVEIPLGQFQLFHKNVFHLDLSGGLRNPKLFSANFLQNSNTNAANNRDSFGNLKNWSKDTRGRILSDKGSSSASSPVGENYDGVDNNGTQPHEDENVRNGTALTQRSLSLLPNVNHFYPRFARLHDTVAGLYQLCKVLSYNGGTTGGAAGGIIPGQQNRAGSCSFDLDIRFQKDSIGNMCYNLARKLIQEHNRNFSSGGAGSSSRGRASSDPRGQASSMGGGMNRRGRETGGGAGAGLVSSAGKKVEILILERAFDLPACFVHEYTYEALVYDVLDDAMEQSANNLSYAKYGLNIETGVINTTTAASSATSGTSNHASTEQHVLADDLWEQLKAQHFVDAQSYVLTQAGKLSEQFGGLAQLEKQGGQQLSTEALAQMVRERPQYQELLRKYHFHVDLFEKAAYQLNEDKLMGTSSNQQMNNNASAIPIELCVFEQDLATGVDREGREMKVLRFNSLLQQILNNSASSSYSSDPNFIPMETKVRLLLLYFSVIGNVPDSSRRQLLDAARLTNTEQQMVLSLMEMANSSNVNNSAAMAQQQNAKQSQNAPFHRSSAKEVKKYKQIAKSARFDMTRFEPRVKDFAETLINNQLDNLLDANGGEIFASMSSTGNNTSKSRSTATGVDENTGTSNHLKTVETALDQVDVTSWSFGGGSGGLGATPGRASQMNKPPSNRNNQDQVARASAATTSPERGRKRFGSAGGIFRGGGTAGSYNDATGTSTASASNQRRDIIVFIIGGITLSEIRELEKIQESNANVNLLIGGSQVLTPKKMLQFLKEEHEMLGGGAGGHDNDQDGGFYNPPGRSGPGMGGGVSNNYGRNNNGKNGRNSDRNVYGASMYDRGGGGMTRGGGGNYV